MPVQDMMRRDQPVVVVARGSKVSGNRVGPDQVERVPALAQGLEVVGDGQVGPVHAGGVAGAGGSAPPGLRATAAA